MRAPNQPQSITIPEVFRQRFFSIGEADAPHVGRHPKLAVAAVQFPWPIRCSFLDDVIKMKHKTLLSSIWEQYHIRLMFAKTESYCLLRYPIHPCLRTDDAGLVSHIQQPHHALASFRTVIERGVPYPAAAPRPRVLPDRNRACARSRTCRRTGRQFACQDRGRTAWRRTRLLRGGRARTECRRAMRR